MDDVRNVIDGLTVLAVWAAIIWIVRRARSYLATQKRLEQQVGELQKAVLVALDDTDRHDAALVDTLKVGQLAGYQRVTDAKLEGYEGNQAALRKEIADLRTENEQLTTRLNNLEDDLAPVRAELALPDPVFSPATEAETAEALKSLRTEGIITPQVPG